MERTVVLLKPSAVPRAENIIRHLKHAGYKIIQSRSVHLSEEQATDFFQEDLDTPNFTKHISYLTSGPVIAMLVQKHQLFEEISSFIDSERSDIDPSLDPNSLREMYGKDILHNAIHYSENELIAKREIHFFFPENYIDPISSISNTTLFLESSIYPTLLQGMAELCKAKPESPATWLGEWLLSNNPYRPTVLVD